jgi:hypothetical protein
LLQDEGLKCWSIWSAQHELRTCGADDAQPVLHARAQPNLKQLHTCQRAAKAFAQISIHTTIRCNLDLTTTLIALVFSLSAFAFASWRGARKTEFGKVRMIPWTGVSLACAVVALFMVVHIVNLLGMTTGRAGVGGR